MSDPVPASPGANDQHQTAPAQPRPDAVRPGRDGSEDDTPVNEDAAPEKEAGGAIGGGTEKKGVERTSSDDTVPLDGADAGEYDDDDAAGDNALQPVKSHAREIWKFRMRPPDDEEPEDWWFASTAIPLLAATSGPLANVLSIAALVVSWRENYDPAFPGIDEQALPYKDPTWCLVLNAVSLVCGFAGNLFLLFNFTRFVRYIVALPLTIILWFVASGILITITACMNVYAAPEWPGATYSQGFWHAIIAAVLYLISSLLLMVNMLGYSLGHYTQHFELTDEQRNLILQTMMFFFWLAGGAAVFSHVAVWSYVDALYFCDVTVLTVGFGDFAAPNDVARGLVFPYSVGGIIMLGLMITSIRNFAIEISKDKIVKGHVERRRQRTMERSVGSSFEAERQVALENAQVNTNGRGEVPVISEPFDLRHRTITFDQAAAQEAQGEQPKKAVNQRRRSNTLEPLKRTMTWASDKMTGPPGKGLQQVTSRKGKLLVLKEEKDRFLAMRAIQYNTRRFKRYFALTMSVIAFGLLWCVGAAVFWICEQRTQGISYFQALYFCYVSLLTIGYGDLAPKSNAGKPFFIVWSLIAVPTMTILISDMSDTVVAAYKRGTFTLAAWTVLPTKGYFREYLESHPWLMALFRKAQALAKVRAGRKRIAQGFPVGPDDSEAARAADEGEAGESDAGDGPTLEQLADENTDEHDLARRLALAIRRTADHLKEGRERGYTYEEWLEYTRLIRFSDYGDDASSSDSSGHMGATGIVNWDWIGPKSPMMSDQSEAEWVLDRLCESLDRYMRKQLPAEVRRRHREQEAELLRRRTAEQFDALKPPPSAGAASSATGHDGAASSPESARDKMRRAAAAFSSGTAGPRGRRGSVGQQDRREGGALGGGLGLLAEMDRQDRRRSSASGPARRSGERGPSPRRERRLSGPRTAHFDVPGGTALMLTRWRERVRPSAAQGMADKAN